MTAHDLRRVARKLAEQDGLVDTDVAGRRRTRTAAESRRRVAARMRALGYSWGQIGKALDRAPGTIRGYRLPRETPTDMGDTCESAACEVDITCTAPTRWRPA